MERVRFRDEVHLEPRFARAILRSADRAAEALGSHFGRAALERATTMKALLRGALGDGTLPREAVLDLLVLFLEAAELAHGVGESGVGFEMEGVEARLLDLLLGEWSGGEPQAEVASGWS